MVKNVTVVIFYAVHNCSENMHHCDILPGSIVTVAKTIRT
jgi:hypothetical protein